MNTSPTLITPRATEIAAGVAVRRALPTRALRTVGAWCFLDHFGPVAGDDMRRFSIGPHPHIGLQTATWLFDGALLHRDSLGSEQLIRAGELNLMTAGQGIAHSEQLAADADRLHGLQFWIALPDELRNAAARFEHHADLPRWRDGAAEFCLFVGRHREHTSPARVHSPLIGLDVQATAAQALCLPLASGFEHALYLVSGQLLVDDQDVVAGQLLALPAGRIELRIDAATGSRFVLLGGTALEQAPLMWWNFVARDRAEIEAARDDWEHGRRFGDVADSGERIKAPVLDVQLRTPAG